MGRKLSLGLCSFVTLLGLAAGGARDAAAQPPLGSTVGIRVTVADVRPSLRQADLDLTMYTRYSYPYSYTFAGAPFVGIPALDYGDGSTVPTTTLALVSSGGGPGGSNVFRSLSSFTHTYPGPGSYTVRAGMFCSFCARGQYVFFPAGSPPPATFTGSFDYVPTSVIGNLAATYTYSGTTSFLFDSSVRYAITAYYAVTNTAQLALPNVLEIPTASGTGLVILGGLLLATGLLLLRRLRAA